MKTHIKVFRTIFEILLVLAVVVLSLLLALKKPAAENVTVEIAPAPQATSEHKSVPFKAGGKHEVFLTNEEGVFRPGDAITRREAALMLAKLVDGGSLKEGEGTFLDVPEEDECYEAVAFLKDLGVISGKYYHPDDKMTVTDFYTLLADNGWVDQPLESDEWMKREDVAVKLCELTGRTGDSKKDLNKVGLFLDVDKDDENLWAIAESTIPHEFRTEDGAEVWTSSEPLPKHKPGYFFVGVALHYVDANGEPLINGSIDGLDFNSRGEETSGDDHLDELIHDAMKELVDPETQKPGEMLKILYDWVAAPDNFNYLVRNFYDVGDTSWVVEEATTMLEKHKGNCYNFAAVFYELARAVGYDAKIYSGIMGDDYRPHAWVEIEFDGQPYIYDAEYQYAHFGSNAYKRDEYYALRYRYHKDGKKAES